MTPSAPEDVAPRVRVAMPRWVLFFALAAVIGWQAVAAALDLGREAAARASVSLAMRLSDDSEARFRRALGGDAPIRIALLALPSDAVVVCRPPETPDETRLLQSLRSVIHPRVLSELPAGFLSMPMPVEHGRPFFLLDLDARDEVDGDWGAAAAAGRLTLRPYRRLR